MHNCSNPFTANNSNPNMSSSATTLSPPAAPSLPEGWSTLLSNTTAETGSSLVLRLVATGGHRDAIGTRVRVGVGDSERIFELTSGDGYLASNQRVLLIGMGSDADTARVEVMWPGRASQVFDELTVDREWTLVEGRGRAISLPRPIE